MLFLHNYSKVWLQKKFNNLKILKCNLALIQQNLENPLLWNDNCRDFTPTRLVGAILCILEGQFPLNIVTVPQALTMGKEGAKCDSTGFEKYPSSKR